MRLVDLIRKKRDGGEHSREEIFSLIDSFTSGEAADYQLAAWLMAACLRGLTEAETAALTEAMLHSGQVMDLSALPGAKVDKHSTGGVGDKTSLILAPVAAAGGLLVPMISGRGLGHTGGTLDKLESIPGFNVNLSPAGFVKVLAACGCVMGGQTAEIVPADKKLYALRDVTGTVESPPLICASIMSKKLAEGIDALVLDVKTGSGAFMKRAEDAERLAAMMVATGRRMGKRMAALITDMDQPLGRAVGNSLEVRECLDVLRGVRHPMSEDLRALSLELAAWMFYLGGRAATVAAGRALGEEMISGGKALRKFREVCRLQGAAPSFDAQPASLPTARHTAEFKASAAGFIEIVDCEKIGLAALALGGGRNKQDDVIDPAVGLELHHKSGHAVKPGDSIATLHYNDEARLPGALRLLGEACRVGPKPPGGARPLIIKVIQGERT
jgi:pyrimidine-nucleoside phosphorylase/thymidine phosphorylase